MQTIFNESQTKINLMRAFAGECQSRQRYYQAALTAQQKKLIVIERLFRFTAEQEERHAMVFWKLMEQTEGQHIDISCGYPVEVTDDIGQLLAAAEKDEENEACSIYPDFARIATGEGFAEAAAKFRMIGDIEEQHRARFEYYSKHYCEGTLFRSGDPEQRWICLNCGHIHVGTEPPQNCPVCNADRGYFLREAEAAFTSCRELGK
ncbi:MAG: rubrerythrin family protein [Ruminococcus sp.]|uniref:rubrerythrin family protein n=1 Tax=Ruminococcus sp. TaxID=41978 RepID=UPI0025D7BEDC|nr:rubrerythrin family protein [Ruminococcus sp.]MCR4794291.1 rubrerythrin family protein [Ruminococcus sp.]